MFTLRNYVTFTNHQSRDFHNEQLITKNQSINFIKNQVQCYQKVLYLLPETQIFD